MSNVVSRRSLFNLNFNFKSGINFTIKIIISFTNIYELLPRFPEHGGLNSLGYLYFRKLRLVLYTLQIITKQFCGFSHLFKTNY